MIIVLLVLSVVVNVFLGVSFYLATVKALNLDDKIDVLSEQVEQSLDVINDCYSRVSSTLEIPVASDDPIVRQFVADINHTRHALLLIANKLVVFEGESEENEEDD